MLKITELPINIDKTFGKLKYGGTSQGYVNLSAEKISANRLIKIKPVDSFSNDDFEFMQDVKLINPTIVQSDISQRNNSGVLQAKIVSIDSTETTYWTNEPTAGDGIVVTFGGNEFEIPVKQYLGSELQFVGVTTGYSQGQSTMRQQAIRNGEPIDNLTEEVVKLAVYDSQKKQNLSIDLPLATLSSIENDYQMGDNIKLVNLRIRFFMPEQGNYSHIMSADNLIKSMNNSRTEPNSAENHKNKPEKNNQ
ncbi:hypothetical protein JOC36_000913 [Weissella uvarum]|uniref:hypothetical protein n=1 Tax=Weissella uvarum TaxID=1479233 RepID=UPI00195FC509|nr:hypothetical protein [Weissella uvarum]MBM7617356.1 hypothetical protein [Weissella uvarum]MCM0595757.1 hypothetical protein [Weissella uvarum]